MINLDKWVLIWGHTHNQKVHDTIAEALGTRNYLVTAFTYPPMNMNVGTIAYTQYPEEGYLSSGDAQHVATHSGSWYRIVSEHLYDRLHPQVSPDEHIGDHISVDIDTEYGRFLGIILGTTDRGDRLY